jgi:hypothetical protein
VTPDEEAAMTAEMKKLEKPAPPAPPTPTGAAVPDFAAVAEFLAGSAAPIAKPASVSDLAPEGEHPLQLDCTGGTGGQVLVKLAPRQWVLGYKVGKDGKPVLTEKGWRFGQAAPGDQPAFAWVDRSKLEENPHIGVDFVAEQEKEAAAKAAKGQTAK